MFDQCPADSQHGNRKEERQRRWRVDFNLVSVVDVLLTSFDPHTHTPASSFNLVFIKTPSNKMPETQMVKQGK